MVAVLIEGLTGIAKSILSSLGMTLRDWVDQAISLTLAVAFAVFGKIDFFAILSQVIHVDFRLPAVLGMIVSGLILSRGSNAIHDLLKRMNPVVEETRIR